MISKSALQKILIRKDQNTAKRNTSPRRNNNYKYVFTECWHSQFYKNMLIDIKGQMNNNTITHSRRLQYFIYK